MFHHGQPVVTAEAVADPGTLPAALVRLGKFSGTLVPFTVQCHGIEDHMVMDMRFVCMRRDNKLVLVLCKLQGKVVANLVCVLQSDFA